MPNSTIAMTRIIQAATPGQVEAVRKLMLEYAATLSCDPCLQRIEQDVTNLPGEYGPPDGRLLLAEHDGEPAGCVALRRIGEGAFEMRRMYVRPAVRGKKVGRGLAEACIREARREGGKVLRLYTLPSMKEAIGLYRSLGFREITPYGDHVIEGALYMEMKIDS